MTRRLNLKKQTRFLLALICIAPFYVASYSGWAGASQKPVAKINDRVLSEADLQEALNELMPAGVFHGGFSSEKRASYRPQALEKMIEKELFYQEALRIELKVDEGLLDKEIDRFEKKFGGKKEYNAALKRAGLTQEQHREKIRRKYLIEKIIEVEIENKAEAFDNEVKIYYDENRKKFMRPEARRITHILISVKPNATSEQRGLKKEEAQKILERINSGEDMSQMAANHSDGPYRVKAGDLGFVHKGRLDPELEQEVFKLEPGRVSDIIETRHGYHIARIEEEKASEQLSFEDVSSGIKNSLTEEREKQLRDALLKKLRAQANIEVFME